VTPFGRNVMAGRVEGRADAEVFVTSFPKAGTRYRISTAAAGSAIDYGDSELDRRIEEMKATFSDHSTISL